MNKTKADRILIAVFGGIFAGILYPTALSFSSVIAHRAIDDLLFPIAAIVGILNAILILRLWHLHRTIVVWGSAFAMAVVVWILSSGFFWLFGNPFNTKYVPDVIDGIVRGAFFATMLGNITLCMVIRLQALFSARRRKRRD